ncbi:ABC transporter permease subunit [Celerinatantimonas sp. YJH-8]|uniref:ABC transporter permease subunit n=1 Tax=Celerinatantimonas sp. YJH-8 TaxID=3228714 RepID=UPI0038C5A2FB
MMNWRKWSRHLGRRALIGIPYGWLLLFFLIPFALVLKISLSEARLAIPPYTPLTEFADDHLTVLINLGNYLILGDDPLYFSALLSSLRIAVTATLGCLLISYPLAWAIAHVRSRYRSLILLLVVLPSWVSFLVRIYAWIGILKNNGLVNNILLWLGIIDQPLHLLYTDFAVQIGIIYAYLPFMVLPIYSSICKLDPSLIEASADLGAKPWKTFWKVVVPLTRGGVLAGVMLVCIPAIGEVVIPELLGGPSSLLIGKVLWQEFFSNRDWPVASALACILLIVLILPILWFHRHQRRELVA